MSARVFSALLAVAAVVWGVFDLWAGYRVVGAATALLAVAFVIQLVQLERAGWRFDGTVLSSRRVRVPARDVEGVHIAFSGRTARAWIETRHGDQVALVEGDEREVRRIADRLSGTLQLASMPLGANLN
ncbi:MAG TPA: hypothetical protein VN928_04740 [Myxococcales bacterium]|nr:hypothetical protein [Myxococcales bacterium]